MRHESPTNSAGSATKNYLFSAQLSSAHGEVIYWTAGYHHQDIYLWCFPHWIKNIKKNTVGRASSSTQSFFSAQFKNSPYLEWRQRAPASSSVAKGFSDPLEWLHTLKDDPQWSFLGQKKEGAAAAPAADSLLNDPGRPGRGERGDGRRRSPHVDYWKCAKDWILLQLLLQQEEDVGGGTETRQRKSSGWSSRARKTARNYFGYCCCCRLLQTPLPSSYVHKKPITRYTTNLDSRHNQLWAHICVLPNSSPHILLFHMKAESRHAAEKESQQQQKMELASNLLR